MKKKRINILSFVLGSIFTLVLIGGIYFGYKYYNDNKSKKDTKKSVKIDNNTVKEGDKKYTIQYERENDLVCDAFNDVWIYNYRYIITNDGKFYYLNEKKYSDNKQNCKLNESIKVKAVIDGHIIDENNNVYLIDNETGNLKIDDSEYTNRLIKSLLNLNVKYAYNRNYKEYAYEYYALKEDGKIYSITIKESLGDFQYNYEVLSDELYKSIDNEKIVYFYINDNNGYIETEKSIFIKTPKNTECMEYADIECDFEYVRDDYLSKYVKDLVSLSVESANFYSVTLKDKIIDISVENK